ncbi:MAG: TonB-dependent receptor [Pseudomonadota bacterium]
MIYSRRFLITLVLAGLMAAPMAIAQESDSDNVDQDDRAIDVPDLDISNPIDEIVTVGRLLDSSQSLALERMDNAAVTDLLGSDQIGRTGDSTVAVALKRVPGLTLVNNQFVYIRGLGERYSQSTLNGARIPSPDLTRNVIPLDIFPTAIIDSLSVQKAYTPDMSANFAGGSVDIRTKGIPDQLVAQFEISTATNSATDGTAFSYAGGSSDDFGTDDGSRALPQRLLDLTAATQGSRLDVASLTSYLQGQNPSLSTLEANAQAVQLNRQLASDLNRSISLEEKDTMPDIGLKGSLGNSFLLGDEWEFGFLVGATYDHQWREEQTVARNFVFPDQRITRETESTRTVNISSIANLGLRFGEEHELTTTTLFLRNTDDETAVLDFFNENREVQDGIGFRDYRLLYEERNMLVNQIRGEHTWGERTRELLGGIGTALRFIPDRTTVSWWISDADAKTEIPNQVNVSSQTVTDANGFTISDAVALDAQAANFRFTDLDDQLESSGIAFKLPFTFDASALDVSFGFDTDRKVRSYLQRQFAIGALAVADTSVLQGPLGSVFSNDNIQNPANNFVFQRQGTNNQSYLAATMTDAAFAAFDWTWNEQWRVAAGLRWEDYRQVAVDWNPDGFSASNPQVTTDITALEQAAFQSDDIYPSLAVTYIDDWLAETFQLRFGFSQTAVRPDLREITDASYIDPITGDLVFGNPGVIPASVDNFDVRAEWFPSNGNNYTVSFFYKDIQDPVEFFEAAASDTQIAREIINAESAEVYGVELEALQNLEFLGAGWERFFIQGNLTLQSTELVAGPDADAPTNPTRALASASDYVANVTFGFDSSDGKHAATLVFNVFGERLYSSGRNDQPDAFEQPFNGLDATYSWYPTDRLIINLKARNVLGETVTIEREGVRIFEQDPGSTLSVSLQWNY